VAGRPFPIHMNNDEGLLSIVKDPLGGLKVEDLVVEAARDLVKDEIKRYIRKKLEEDPKLKEEIRTAVSELMDAKIREAYAMVKLGKCGVDLGIALVPPDMKQRMDRDIAGLLERELGQVVSKIE
jgi:adenosyl cobinamide kinase/adenosyl cobinamide phosphate guanylyltransferase